MAPERDMAGHVRETLETVLDPCSCHTDRPVNIVDLGLVEEISIDDSRVEICLVLTSGNCLYAVNIADEIERKLLVTPGIEEVTVHSFTDVVWTPERMAAEEHEERRNRYVRRMEESGLTKIDS